MKTQESNGGETGSKTTCDWRVFTYSKHSLERSPAKQWWKWFIQTGGDHIWKRVCFRATVFPNQTTILFLVNGFIRIRDYKKKKKSVSICVNFISAVSD